MLIQGCFKEALQLCCFNDEFYLLHTHTHTHTWTTQHFSLQDYVHANEIKWVHNTYQRYNFPFWLACEAVVLIGHQRTVGRFVYLDQFLTGIVHLFFNSLQIQEQDVQEQMIREGERKREKVICEMRLHLKILKRI